MSKNEIKQPAAAPSAGRGKTKHRGLGRGLEALIPKVVEPEFDTVADPGRIQDIKLELIDANPHQPRTNFKTAELDALAESIGEHGVLQPVVLQPIGQRYQLVAGERRVRASRLLGVATIPGIVRTFDEQQSLELALVENIQREQLNPVETATAYQKLLDQFGLSLKIIARRVGRDESTVQNTLRLLGLPLPAKRALAESAISEGHARSILSVQDPKQQQKLLESIIKHGWTVRRAEEFARAAKGSTSRTPAPVAQQNEQTRAIAKYLGTDVAIEPRSRGGRLVIRYFSDDELDEFVNKLTKDKH